MDQLERPGKADIVIRASEDLVHLCRELGVNMSEVARAALAREVRRRTRLQKAAAFPRDPFEYRPPARPRRRLAPPPPTRPAGLTFLPKG